MQLLRNEKNGFTSHFIGEIYITSFEAKPDKPILKGKRTNRNKVMHGEEEWIVGHR